MFVCQMCIWLTYLFSMMFIDQLKAIKLCHQFATPSAPK
uniref:Uncharacterized protein n=1 Tax=Arundo donax TaxID=35708 RepID=A0A0A9A805_ARUDO